jgi:transcriptional regulator with XRE-family HTH domain
MLILLIEKLKGANMNKERNIFKLLRLIRNIKVSELAEMLDTSVANISSIENGRSQPSRRLLRDYAQVLGVTPEFISNHASNAENKDSRFEDYLFEVLNEVLELDRKNIDCDESMST